MNKLRYAQMGALLSIVLLGGCQGGHRPPQEEEAAMLDRLVKQSCSLRAGFLVGPIKEMRIDNTYTQNIDDEVFRVYDMDTTFEGGVRVNTFVKAVKRGKKWYWSYEDAKQIRD